MGELRDKMKKEMELRNLSSKTIESYMWYMTDFARFSRKSPAEIGEDEVREYLYYLKVKKRVSWSSSNVAYCALRFFYVKTLNRGWNIARVPRQKSEEKLPVVLSCSEVKMIFDSTCNFKYRVILETTYSSGLRISETAHLKITDIDSARMMIRVNQGKGKKDRYTLLSKVLLEELRKYYKVYRPTLWLFPGRKYNQPISTSAIQKAFRESKKKAGILKPATVHTLRHSFATHLLEQGVDIFTIQKLLGHKRLATTSIYIHIQRKNLNKIINPLDHIFRA